MVRRKSPRPLTGYTAGDMGRRSRASLEAATVAPESAEARRERDIEAWNRGERYIPGYDNGNRLGPAPPRLANYEKDVMFMWNGR